LLFGLLADRYGRRIPLMANVIYFSIIELLCGFAPSFKVFLILRALFGIGMAGVGVGASLAMEQRRFGGVEFSAEFSKAVIRSGFFLPQCG